MFWIACQQSLTEFMWSIEDRPNAHGFVESSQEKMEIMGINRLAQPQTQYYMLAFWKGLVFTSIEGGFQDHKLFTGNLLWGSCRYQVIERNYYHSLFKTQFRYNSCDSFDAAGFRNSEQPSCGSTDTRCRQQVHLVIKRCANRISFKWSERSDGTLLLQFVE